MNEKKTRAEMKDAIRFCIAERAYERAACNVRGNRIRLRGETDARGARWDTKDGGVTHTQKMGIERC